MISLEQPDERYLESYFEALAEFRSEGSIYMPDALTPDQFPAYVRRLHDQSFGKGLPEGHIPSKEFWIVDQDGFAGRIILGLTYIPGPTRFGNHVGYAVRPSKRRKGYATMALSLLLNEARELGVQVLMPTCGSDNLASRNVIEKNGGVLVKSETDDNGKVGELRFRIQLKSESD